MRKVKTDVLNLTCGKGIRKGRIWTVDQFQLKQLTKSRLLTLSFAIKN